MELPGNTHLIEIIFNYKGILIEAEIRPGKDCYGSFYVVDLNGNYAYTLHCDAGIWIAVNKNDGSLTQIDNDFLQILTRQLSWEINRLSLV